LAFAFWGWWYWSFEVIPLLTSPYKRLIIRTSKILLSVLSHHIGQWFSAPIRVIWRGFLNAADSYPRPVKSE
jgi:hypothetical protein